MKTTHYLLAFLLLITSVSAVAQNWTGSWNSSFGELRLHQVQTKVYGDYRDLGSIDGNINGSKLVGTFTNGDGSGNFIWTLSANGTSFTGKWTWAGTNDWKEWNGSLKNSAAPKLTSNGAIEKKKNHLNGITGEQKIHVKIQYATFGDTKSNPDEFSIFGLASVNLMVSEDGQTNLRTRGPRFMSRSEERAIKTKRTSSGTKLINFNEDFIVSVPNKEYLDPAKAFLVLFHTDFKSKGFFKNEEFGKASMKTNVDMAEPNKSYSIKSSKGNLISNVFFTIKKTS